jgi:hypothetical protein
VLSLATHACRRLVRWRATLELVSVAGNPPCWFAIAWRPRPRVRPAGVLGHGGLCPACGKVLAG